MRKSVKSPNKKFNNARTLLGRANASRLLGVKRKNHLYEIYTRLHEHEKF
jgi:hypothetical protein